MTILALRIGCIVFAFLSLFLFPWNISLICLFFAGIAFPPAAAFLGIIADILYYPGHGILWGTAWGVGLGILAFAVRYIVKTRIM